VQNKFLENPGAGFREAGKKEGFRLKKGKYSVSRRGQSWEPLHRTRRLRDAGTGWEGMFYQEEKEGGDGGAHPIRMKREEQS